MNGMFDVKLINNRGKKDGYFEQAIQDGYIMDALDDLPAVRHLSGQQNWIFDNYAGGMIRNVLSGPAHTGLWETLYSETAQNASLAFIMLTTTSALPTYQEDLLVMVVLATRSMPRIEIQTALILVVGQSVLLKTK